MHWNSSSYAPSPITSRLFSFICAPSPSPSAGFLQFWDRFFYPLAFYQHDTTGGQASKCTHREGDYGHGTPGDFYSSSGSLFLGKCSSNHNIPWYAWSTYIWCLGIQAELSWGLQTPITIVINARCCYYKAVITLILSTYYSH